MSVGWWARGGFGGYGFMSTFIPRRAEILPARHSIPFHVGCCDDFLTILGQSHPGDRDYKYVMGFVDGGEESGIQKESGAGSCWLMISMVEPAEGVSRKPGTLSESSGVIGRNQIRNQAVKGIAVGGTRSRESREARLERPMRCNRQE